MNDFTDNIRRGLNRSMQQESQKFAGGVGRMLRDMLTGSVREAERDTQREVGRGMNDVRRDAGIPQQQTPAWRTPGIIPERGGYGERPLPNGDNQIRVGGKIYTEGGQPQREQRGNASLGESMKNQTTEQKRQSAQALGLGDKEYGNLIAQQLNHEERAARRLPNARTSPLEMAVKTERANFAKSGLSEDEWGKIKVAENDFQNRLHGGGNISGASPIKQVLDTDTGQPAFQRPRLQGDVILKTITPDRLKAGTPKDEADFTRGKSDIGREGAMSYAAPEQTRIESPPLDATTPAMSVATGASAPATPQSSLPTARQLTEQGGLKASDYTAMRGGQDGAVSTAPAAAPAVAASSDAPAGLKNVDAYQRWKQHNPGLSQ